MKLVEIVDRWLGLAWKVAIIGACVFFLLTRGRSTPEITVGQVRQDVVHGPLPASAMTNPAALLHAVNDYRTAPGWIAASNDRIWAGLSNRMWSAPYDLPDHRHEVTIWAGQGIGLGYQYQLFDHWSVGGLLLYSGEQVSGLAGVGYRW